MRRLRSRRSLRRRCSRASSPADDNLWRRRDLAAWLGLVPRQFTTGGKPKPLGISKRGNKYLRRQLIHGARAALPYLAERDTLLGRWAKAPEVPRPNSPLAILLLTAWRDPPRHLESFPPRFGNPHESPSRAFGITHMIAIAITPDAYEAIKASLSELDNPASPGPDGLLRVWLDRATLGRLGRISGPVENYSDVILRLPRS
jgi:hypothetical protein